MDISLCPDGEQLDWKDIQLIMPDRQTDRQHCIHSTHKVIQEDYINSNQSTKDVYWIGHKRVQTRLISIVSKAIKVVVVVFVIVQLD